MIANFLDDWGAILEDQLQRRGVKIAPGRAHQQISFAYWNCVRRFIEPQPREVKVADTFHCPPENQQGLAELRGRLERGEDVNPHLSNACRDAADPNFHDRLLNDWDIQHLHLGATTAADQVERSRNVLLYPERGPRT